MPDKRVFNASPLIVLGKVNQLSLLVELCETIVIPAAVATEIGHGSPDDCARKWIGAQGSSCIKDVGHVHPAISAWDLGSGESEVLSWAYENPGFEVVIDCRNEGSKDCSGTGHHPSLAQSRNGKAVQGPPSTWRIVLWASRLRQDFYC